MYKCVRSSVRRIQGRFKMVAEVKPINSTLANRTMFLSQGYQVRAPCPEIAR